MAQGSPSASKRSGDALVEQSRFEQAADAYDKAAQGFIKSGDPNAAQVCQELSLRYRTSIRVFRKVPVTAGLPLAKHEPPAGMLLGVNVEREDSSRNYQVFSQMIGRWHSMYFRYRAYGAAFPTQDALNAKKAKAALQIAFEPKTLYDVDASSPYLEKFAKDAAATGVPIFLRFAGEMNGTWVPYGGDPAEYKRKFREVASVMRQYAPNVAMVWCPNWTPQSSIPDYYPGSDAVDWVGVNFYSVIYSDGDRNRPAEWRYPTDHLDFVYKKYAGAHPMMVGEWAATHQSAVDNVLRTDFAIQKIEEFFRTVPLLYPRLKASSWLSYNAIKYAREDRKLNNYSLLDQDAVGEAYRKETADEWVLPRWDTSQPSSPSQWIEVKPGSTLKKGETVRVWVRSPYEDLVIKATADGKVLLLPSRPVAFEWIIPSMAKVSVFATTGGGKEIKRTPAWLTQ